jgi:hypothetical protein
LRLPLVHSRRRRNPPGRPARRRGRLLTATRRGWRNDPRRVCRGDRHRSECSSNSSLLRRIAQRAAAAADAAGETIVDHLDAVQHIEAIVTDVVGAVTTAMDRARLAISTSAPRGLLRIAIYARVDRATQTGWLVVKWLARSSINSPHDRLLRAARRQLVTHRALGCMSLSPTRFRPSLRVHNECSKKSSLTCDLSHRAEPSW